MRHAFHAMGTEVQLHLDATPAADALLVEAEGEFHRLEALLSRFLPTSELTRLQRGRRARSRPGPARCRRRGPRGAQADRGQVRPDRPRRARGSRVRPQLRARARRRRCARPGRERAAAASRSTARRRGSASIPGEARPRRHRQGLRRRPGARDARRRRPGPRRRRRRHRRRGQALARRRGHLRGDDCARAERRRTRHLRLRPAPLGRAGGRGLARHHLIDPSTGRPADGELLRVTVAAAKALEAEVLAKALFLAGSTRAAAAEADELGIPAVLVSREEPTVLAGGVS